MTSIFRSSSGYLTVAIFIPVAGFAQGTLADYQRAHDLQAKARGLVVNAPGPITWIDRSDHFWYSRSVKGGFEFVLVDAATSSKKLAFDHEKLATAISSATGKKYAALALPFAPSQDGRGGRAPAGGPPQTAPLTFLDHETAIQFGTGGFLYQCALTGYTCAKGSPIPASGAGGRGGVPEDESTLSPEGPGGDPADGLEYQPPAPQQANEPRVNENAEQRPCAEQQQDRAPRTRREESGPRGVGFVFPGQRPFEPAEVCTSFDGKWQALIENYNVFLRQAGSSEPATPLSTDGSEGNYYTFRSIAWSPDSTKVTAYRTRPGYDREVHYIESSPPDQIQPKHMTISYRKPGDALDIAEPVLFDRASKKEIEIDRALFPNPYN